MTELHILQAFMAILCLYLGAEALVKGSLKIAAIFGISPLVAGLTIVSLGTSLPEAVVSLMAQYSPGGSDIAITNIIGSNISNIGLVLGLSIFLVPMKIEERLQGKEYLFLLSTAVLLLFISIWGSVLPIIGLILILALFYYMYRHYKSARVDLVGSIKINRSSYEIILSIFMISGGSLLLFLGGNFLIESAVVLARYWGVSNRFIGITLVAIGTSLPELSASLVAVFKKHHHIALGNIVGSNILNVLFVLGSVGCFAPIYSFASIIVVDAIVMLFFTLFLVYLIKSNDILGRFKGALLLLLYSAYLLLLYYTRL